MNLKPLFDMQRTLDGRIIEEKGLEGQDLLPEKILALQVELGELANEWRGFKFWSNNRKPNKRNLLNEKDEKKFIELHGWSPNDLSNPLLEEYVDCLHFILSIGLTRGYDLEEFDFEGFSGDIVSQFNWLFDKIGDFYGWKTFGNYKSIFAIFISLGEMLGFTWEQIEQAYKEKNATNHLRQTNGY